MSLAPAGLLTDELHIHLYGCLTATDVWTLGRDRYRDMGPRLEWYANEYQSAYGRRPDYLSYWEKGDGLERLTADFEFTEHGSFPQFQARFNLMIALFPAVPGDTRILEHVLVGQRAQGIRYGEYRCFTPPHLHADQITTMVGAMAETTARIDRESGGQFKPRLAWSISRLPGAGTAQYLAIRAAMQASTERQRVVTGIDFCGVEEGHPPAPMAGLFAQIRADNQRDPASALAILYHVGESFDGMSVMSAMRWVWQAHALGAHRLGHATALGLDLTALAASTGQEGVVERLQHLAWLEHNADWLLQHGHVVKIPTIHAEQEYLSGLPATAVVDLTYDPETITAAKTLQQALLTDLAAKGAIVESCPSSNLRIGRIINPRHHPLIQFVEHNITTVVSSDDPGIFALDLAHEERVCTEALGLPPSTIQRLQSNNKLAWSETLTGRF